MISEMKGDGYTCGWNQPIFALEDKEEAEYAVLQLEDIRKELQKDWDKLVKDHSRTDLVVDKKITFYGQEMHLTYDSYFLVEELEICPSSQPGLRNQEL